MQAIRVERKKSLDPRWLQHLSLLCAVAFLLSWIVATRSPAAQLVESLPIPFLAPPSTPAQEWRPIRVPVRTSPQREPWQPEVVGVPPLGEAPAEGVQRVGDAAQWVQAHRRTSLLAAPELGAAPTVEIAQWSHLKVVETLPNGWLRVGYGDDGAGRPIHVAWISAGDIGVSGGPPRFVTSTRDTPLWNADGPSAQPVATIPRLAMLELAGAERNGRVAVRLTDATGSGQVQAWVDWEAVTGSVGPSDRDVPLARPFSPFAPIVRLDIPYRTQLDGSISAASNCGPASIAMAIEAFGMAVPTWQARALATRFMGVYSPWSGTTLESLRHVARSFGLDGLDLYEDGRYRRWTIEDVRRHVRAGHPVIPQLRYRLMPGREWFAVTFDHYVVITGLDGDDFIYNDPATVGGRGQGVMSAQSLWRAWMGSDHPGAALAVARPI
jgi:hypothetical protein